MAATDGFVCTLKRTVRVVPIFLILASVGTAAVYALGVPVSDMGIAAAVPLLVLFVISRIVVLAIPSPSQTRQTGRPPRLFMALAVLMFGGAFGALDLVFSAAIFSLLGFPHLSHGALTLAAGCGLLSSLALILAVLEVLQHVGINITELIIIGLWKAFACPSFLADRVLVPHWHNRAS